MNIKDVLNEPEDAAFEVDGQMVPREALVAKLKAELDTVRADVIAQRDEWVQHRSSSGIERRWQLCNDLYYGKDTVDSALVELLKNGPSPKGAAAEEANRSRVVVNIVRPKVDQAVARMCEILLPTDDKNWGIKPTPVPQKVSKMLGDDRVTVDASTGQPNPDGMTADQEAQRFIAECKTKAEAMERTIDDQLNECKYNAEQRAAINDGVRIGTAIMLGPFPSKQMAKVWAADPTTGEHSMQVNSRTVPASCRADPWDVWFDPAAGKDHQNGAGYWHKRMVTRKQIRGLQDVPGFDSEALRDVLREAPSRVTIAEGRVRKTNAIKEQAYEMWTYHGELEPDAMRVMSSVTDDPLEDVDFGVVVLINDRVVGTLQSWIVDKTLPVDVWCWRESDDSPYGHGLPEELESQQRVCTSAWRQVMDNARFSVGPQLVFLDGVTPVDGKQEIYPGKKWRCAPEKINDVRMAMASIDFSSHLDELLKIAQVAQEMADSETNMPQLLGGEQGSAPETLGGTVMLYNNANAVLRLRVKLYDDGITSPHIGRYYDWNMANNPDDAIKGDMEVDARGSTALLEKDIENQATVNLAAITGNPRYAPYLDAKEELKVILKAFRMQPEKIMATDDQIKKNLEAPAPQDPRVLAAQATLKAKEMDIADRKEQRQVDMQEAAEDRVDHRADRNYNQRREQAEYEIAMTHEQNARDMQEQRLVTEAQSDREKLEADTGIKRLDIDTKRQLFNAEAALKMRQGSGI